MVRSNLPNSLSTWLVPQNWISTSSKSLLRRKSCVPVTLSTMTRTSALSNIFSRWFGSLSMSNGRSFGVKRLPLAVPRRPSLFRSLQTSGIIWWVSGLSQPVMNSRTLVIFLLPEAALGSLCSVPGVVRKRASSSVVMPGLVPGIHV